MNGFAAFLLAALLGQDPAPLIERLKEKDPHEVERAQDELLKIDSAAPALREAAGKTEDAALGKRLAWIADRLEARRAAVGLLHKPSDLWYGIYVDALKIGWSHLKTEAVEGNLRFTDELFLQPNRNESVTLKAQLTCRPDEYLSLVDLSVTSSHPDEGGTFTGRVKEGRLIVKKGEEVKAVKLNGDVVVDLALLRLVTLLPPTEGYELTVVELFKPKFKEGASLRLEKEETIEHDGRRLRTKRFMLSDGGEEEKYYWVDADRRLVKVRAGTLEAVLQDEARARDIDTKE